MTIKDTQAVGRRVDPFQDEAINCRESGIRIVAPAGSGKTETLVRRAVKRIDKDGVKPERLLVLTFDNSAKKSFETSFKRIAPKVSGPNVSTLNAFGNNLVKRYFHQERGELVRGPQQGELYHLLHRDYPRLDVLHWDGRHRSLHEAFSSLKSQGFLPTDSEAAKATRWLRSHFLQLPDHGESLTVGDLWSLDESRSQPEQYDAQIAEIFTSYLRFDHLMRDRGWMDYDDQKLRALKGLRENHDTRSKVRDLYDEVIVDECQDINRLEALLIWSIVGESTTLVLAGDDDQSLYEFKEANSLYLREPDRHFGRAFETCHLNINYRTPQELLGPALKLIDHNFERLEKSPHSGVPHAGQIELHPAKTVQGHDQELATRVSALIGTNGTTGTMIRAEDVAVLCPDEPVAMRMRRALSRFGINTAVITTADGRQPEGLVFVDTMRKAKGRQWRVVVLPDSNDGVMPGDRSVRSGDVESQRRQYYVAMTRPSETLIVGYLRRDDHDELFRTSRGETLGTNGASRFLFEAGLIGVNEAEPISPPLTVVTPPTPPENKAHVRNGESAETLPALENSATPEKPLPDLSGPIAAKTCDQPVTVSVATVPAKRIPKERIDRDAQPWDLRQDERDALEKAQGRMKNDDPIYAVADTFKAIEKFLVRVTGSPRKTKLIYLIDTGYNLGIFDSAWRDTLNDWRPLRNEGIHEKVSFNARECAKAEEVVHRAPELFEHIGERMRPKPLSALFVNEPRIKGISMLASLIQTGSPSPVTSKPIRSLRFHPVDDAKDMVFLQLFMVLRDVRYYTPEQFRWSTSPIFAQLSNGLLGYCHPAIRGFGRNQLSIFSPSETAQIVDLMRQIVLSELGGRDCKLTLQRAFDDAQRSRIGDYSAGLKLNPKQS
ncbi:MAG: hypothetical protein AVDCRST_MAG93-5618 [uncultured Chloroflexia bacterium]|uniref:DNA 3'-5' helicase n=1 Tax=uncultured Chloroflexia bacterium TaxID=1672391 RepID=A0A6J4KZF8_9CHLR|nr:MAG: hypothetical protein AVDCRST_MAG93-5618 [uncultured Chloroflexia bacterium]